MPIPGGIFMADALLCSIDSHQESRLFTGGAYDLYRPCACNIPDNSIYGTKTAAILCHLP